MSDLIDLLIDGIAAGGDGVGRHDGMVVFVPRTAPGDRVRVQVDRKKRFARGVVDRVEVESKTRVVPACPHYDGDHCGGCQLQHLSYPTQLEAKQRVIQDSIARIGNRRIVPPPIVSATSPWRYRHRLALAMRAGPDGRWRAGLHTFDQPDVVFDLHDCHIADERLLSLWRDVLKASDALPEVRELRGTVRLAGEHGAFTLEGATAWPRAAEFAERLPRFVGVWWVPAHGRRRAIFANPDAAAAASFTQVNPAMGARLLDYLERLVVGASPLHVIDAYSGHGALAARLHQRGIRVTAIELDEDATAFAAARLTPPSRAVAAKVEDAMARALPADLVVLNPPRAGVDARVTAALRAPDGPRRAIYISCDPATLARDISRLPSWEIDSVQAFDMFPQTAHVETVVALSRTRG